MKTKGIWSVGFGRRSVASRSRDERARLLKYSVMFSAKGRWLGTNGTAATTEPRTANHKGWPGGRGAIEVSDGSLAVRPRPSFLFRRLRMHGALELPFAKALARRGKIGP
mmetsp:Transcript_18971/g.50145  ORF Transcript_18971/g.50145 Transcript_18971/m.50145 type:complete len:110 (-) Transcript_18971:192-521(-)